LILPQVLTNSFRVGHAAIDRDGTSA